MEDAPARKSHALMWALCVMVGLPLLYLLSLPPLYRCMNQYSNPPGTLHPRKIIPAWVHTYADPYLWLANNTPLKQPLYRYADGWGMDWYGYPMFLGY